MTGPRIIDFQTPCPGETAPVDPARVVAGAPLATTVNRYAEAGNRFFAGEWSSTVGIWRIHYTEHVFCQLLEGRVRLTSDCGEQWQFEAGDAWVIPAGFTGTWETVTPARKRYAIYEPAD